MTPTAGPSTPRLILREIESALDAHEGLEDGVLIVEPVDGGDFD